MVVASGGKGPSEEPGASEEKTTSNKTAGEPVAVSPKVALNSLPKS